MTAYYFEIPVNATIATSTAWLNTITSGLFWTLLSAFIFIVLYLTLEQRYGMKKALPSAATGSLILSVILLVLGLVNNVLVMLYFVALVISQFLLREKGSGG